MKFEKFTAKLIKDSSDTWKEIFTKTAEKPYLLSVMRYHWDTNQLLRMAMSRYYDDIVAVTSKEINAEYIRSHALYAYTFAIFKQFADLQLRVKSIPSLQDDANSAKELLDDLDCDCNILVGVVGLFSSTRELDTSLRATLATACNKWTRERMIVVVPK